MSTVVSAGKESDDIGKLVGRCDTFRRGQFQKDTLAFDPIKDYCSKNKIAFFKTMYETS